MNRLFKLCCLVTLVFVSACSDSEFQEVIFRHSVESDLKKQCGQDVQCVLALEAQLKSCMEQADWYRYVQNSEDAKEKERFANEFFSCFKDLTDCFLYY